MERESDARRIYPLIPATSRETDPIARVASQNIQLMHSDGDLESLSSSIGAIAVLCGFLTVSLVGLALSEIFR